MPYATGTANTAGELKTAVNNFCTANGFTLTSDVLHSANSFTKLTETSSEILTLTGSGSVDMLTDLQPSYTQVRIPGANFPVTYEFFIHGASGENANPLSFFGIIKYNADTHVWLSFGEFRKTNPALEGGSFYAATYRKSPLSAGTTGDPMANIEINRVCMTALQGGHNTFNAAAQSGGFFFRPGDTTIVDTRNSHARCTIDGEKWPLAVTNLILRPMLERQPNLWNGQTVFFPVKLSAYTSDNTNMIMGTIPWVRLVRVDNYNSGDIITYGADQWKIFPFWQKDTLNRNGNLTNENPSCGTFGWAIKYDGA